MRTVNESMYEVSGLSRGLSYFSLRSDASRATEVSTSPIAGGDFVLKEDVARDLDLLKVMSLGMRPYCWAPSNGCRASPEPLALKRCPYNPEPFPKRVVSFLGKGSGDVCSFV